MRRLIVLVPVLLSGCAADSGEFPSLAKRPYEIDVQKRVATPAPQPPAPLPAAEAARAAQIVARADEAHAGFVARAGKVARQVSAASGSAVGSEAWTAAQVEVSRLEALRGPEVEALADLDALYLERVRVSGAAGAAELAGMLARIQQQAEADRQRVEALAAQLPD